jgi:hypothetical protein
MKWTVFRGRSISKEKTRSVGRVVKLKEQERGLETATPCLEGVAARSRFTHLLSEWQSGYSFSLFWKQEY